MITFDNNPITAAAHDTAYGLAYRGATDVAFHVAADAVTVRDTSGAQPPHLIGVPQQEDPWQLSSSIGQIILPEGVSGRLYREYHHQENREPAEMHSLHSWKLAWTTIHDGRFHVYLTEAGPLPAISIIRPGHSPLRQDHYSYPNHLNALCGQSSEPGAPLEHRDYAIVAIDLAPDGQPYHRRVFEDVAEQLELLFVDYAQKFPYRADAPAHPCVIPSQNTMNRLEHLNSYHNSANPDLKPVADYIAAKRSAPTVTPYDKTNHFRLRSIIAPANACQMPAFRHHERLLNHLMETAPHVPWEPVQRSNGDIPQADVTQVTVTGLNGVTESFAPDELPKLIAPPESTDTIIAVAELSLRVAVTQDDRELGLYDIPSPIWVDKNAILHTGDAAQLPNLDRIISDYDRPHRADHPEAVQEVFDYNVDDVYSDFIHDCIAHGREAASAKMINTLAGLLQTLPGFTPGATATSPDGNVRISYK